MSTQPKCDWVCPVKVKQQPADKEHPSTPELARRSRTIIARPYYERNGFFEFPRKHLDAQQISTQAIDHNAIFESNLCATVVLKPSCHDPCRNNYRLGCVCLPKVTVASMKGKGANEPSDVNRLKRLMNEYYSSYYLVAQ
eukprot:6182600-Pleurochrysis_carterae.AAC.1